MSELFEKLQSDVKDAMRARDSERVGALRLLVSSLKNQQIELRRELTDDDVIGVLSTEAKKRREAIGAYEGTGREEMVEKEQAELAIIQEYLPQPLTDDEVRAMIDEVITQTGAASKADMGKVMGQMMPRVRGRYDGAKVKDLVLEKLG